PRDLPRLPQLRPGALGNLAEDLRMRAVWQRRGDRLAGVGAQADVHVERHPSEEPHAEPLRFRLGAAVAEDVGVLPALGANEGAHVLDDAEHRDADLTEHGEALTR